MDVSERDPITSGALYSDFSSTFFFLNLAYFQNLPPYHDNKRAHCSYSDFLNC